MRRFEMGMMPDAADDFDHGVREEGAEIGAFEAARRDERVELAEDERDGDVEPLGAIALVAPVLRQGAEAGERVVEAARLEGLHVARAPGLVVQEVARRRRGIEAPGATRL